jgi:hypothetical protein
MRNDEHGLRAVIETSMVGVCVPTARLAAGAVEQGRRLRRRRRAATMAGAAALAAVVGFGIPQAVGSHTGDLSVASGNADAPGPTVSSGDQPQGWWSMPASTMADHLREMLPRGTRIVALRTRSEEPGDTPGEWQGFLVAHIDTPISSGPGGINLWVGSPDTAPPGAGPSGPVTPGADAPVAGSWRSSLRCPGNLAKEPTSCEVLRDAAGHRVGRLARTDLGDVVLLSAVVRTTDGGIVAIDASNSTDDKWGLGSHTTADEPPLTLAQLRAIAADPVWTGYRP